MAKDYDEDMLTEEERAALEVDGDDAGALDEDDPTAEAGASNPAPVDADAQAAADAGEDEEEEEPAPAQDAAQGDDPAPEPDPQPAPDVDLAAITKTLGTYKDDRKALLDEFNNGDLTDDEFESKLDELDDAVASARVQKHEFDRYEQQQETRWEGAVADHMAKYPEFGADKGAMEAFDRIVRQVTVDPDYARMSFAEQLDNAHAMLEVKAQRTGMKGVPPLKATGAKPVPNKPQQQQRKAPEGDDLSEPPRTLARAPASEITSNDDEFSTLREIESKGTPDQFEAAMAAMSPEQRDRYSSMSD